MVILSEVYATTHVKDKERRIAKRQSRRKRTNIIVRQTVRPEPTVVTK